VATSRSLFVAAPPLILALLDDVIKTFETGNDGVFSETKNPFVSYLTGQVVAAYIGRERRSAFPTKDFACLRVAPPCGTEAGAFLTTLKKITFSTT
jgi:hypothetical protein